MTLQLLKLLSVPALPDWSLGLPAEGKYTYHHITIYIAGTHHQLHNYRGDASIIPGTRGLESCVTSSRLGPILLGEGGELCQHLGPALTKECQEAGVTRREKSSYHYEYNVSYFIAELAIVLTITDSDMSSLS